MSEPIKVFRSVSVEDEYGDPQPATWVLWREIPGLFAPANPTEKLEPGRNTVISGGAVYIRGAEPTGIRATDQVEMRGIRFAVDGDVGSWSGKQGYKGDQFAVKAVG